MKKCWFCHRIYTPSRSKNYKITSIKPNSSKGSQWNHGHAQISLKYLFFILFIFQWKKLMFNNSCIVHVKLNIMKPLQCTSTHQGLSNNIQKCNKGQANLGTLKVTKRKKQTTLLIRWFTFITLVQHLYIYVYIIILFQVQQ